MKTSPDPIHDDYSRPADEKVLLVAFGERVRVLRKQAGISQEELGGRAGLHRTYVADVERGARNLSLVSINKLANGLNIALSQFFVRPESIGAQEPQPRSRS